VIVRLAVIAIVALSYFIVWELTERHPIMHLSLFRGINFTVGTVAISLGYLVFFGNIVIFSLWLQTQMAYTATWAGFAAAFIGILLRRAVGAGVVLPPAVHGRRRRGRGGLTVSARCRAIFVGACGNPAETIQQTMEATS
jgi:hypothetical protein